MVTCCPSRRARWCAAANRAGDPTWRCRSWVDDASPSSPKWPIGASCIALSDVSAQHSQIRRPLGNGHWDPASHTRSLCKSDRVKKVKVQNKGRGHGSGVTSIPYARKKRAKERKRGCLSSGRAAFYFFPPVSHALARHWRPACFLSLSFPPFIVFHPATFGKYASTSRWTPISNGKELFIITSVVHLPRWNFLQRAALSNSVRRLLFFSWLFSVFFQSPS